MPEALSFLKAASDPTRLRILMLLKERPCCVCELIYVLGEEQSLVSHHMRVRRSAGIVECARRGRWMEYRLSRNRERRVRALLDEVLKGMLDETTAVLLDVRRFAEVKKGKLVAFDCGPEKRPKASC